MKIISSLIFLIFLWSCSDDKKLFSLVDNKISGIDFNNVIYETDEFNILTDEYIFNGGV